MPNENPYAPPSSDVAVSESNQLAGRWRRLGGALIDGIVAMLVLWPAMYFTGYWTRAMAGEQSISDSLLLVGMSIGLFVVVNGYLLVTSGQTIGKRLVNTRIVSVTDNEILPLVKVVGLRYVPIWVVGVVPVLGPIISLINVLFIFRQDKRCIHDLIAGTKVVNA